MSQLFLYLFKAITIATPSNLRHYLYSHMKKIIIAIIGIAIIAAGSFFAGMKYDQQKNPISTRTPGGSANLSPEERQARAQQLNAGGANGNQRGARGGLQGGFIGGEVLSKDDKSVTIKLRDGGSKIIFFSQATQVMKSVAGSLQDLTIGQQITAGGSPNADGSITAQSIQLRPPLPTNK